MRRGEVTKQRSGQVTLSIIKSTGKPAETVKKKKAPKKFAQSRDIREDRGTRQSKLGKSKQVGRR